MAIDLAAKRGVESVTTQDMADAMGLTQGAIFRHFPTKDDIWLAAIHWVRRRLMRVVVDAAATQRENPLDALERMFSCPCLVYRQAPGYSAHGVL